MNLEAKEATKNWFSRGNEGLSRGTEAKRAAPRPVGGNIIEGRMIGTGRDTTGFGTAGG
jgi:hypothetical protein